MIFVEIDDQYRDLVPRELLQEAAQITLQLSYQVEIPSLSIKITGEKEIQALNASYRGIDKATDVLAFEGDYFDPDLESQYLGDVVISYPQAANQALKRGHRIPSELQLLVIHGVLHLLGYDHDTPEDKEEMWTYQNQILNALGLDLVIEDE
jgi:probable rRNA maturation factor